MNTIEHPVRDLLDAVALAGHRPPAEELDTLCADVTREDLGDTSITAAQLRRELMSNIDDIVTAHGDGNSGDARRIAREATAKVADRLPAYRRPSRDQGKSVREIVDSIPRGFA